MRRIAARSVYVADRGSCIRERPVRHGRRSCVYGAIVLFRIYGNKAVVEDLSTDVAGDFPSYRLIQASEADSPSIEE